MATYVLLVLVILAGVLLLRVVWRVFVVRSAQSHAPRPVYNPFSTEQIERAFVQLQQTLERQPVNGSVLPHHGYPDALQWLGLLQQTPQEAADLLNALRMQVAMRGVNGEVIAIDSIIAYEAARKYLQTHGPLPAMPQAQASTRATTDEAYPNEQEWRRRLTEDRQKAVQFLRQMEFQRARFGPSAPPMLDASIAAFQRAERNESGENESGSSR